MSLTIPDLTEPLRQRLIAEASKHGQSVEAEALELLIFAMKLKSAEPDIAEPSSTNICDSVRGIWKGRSTTDEMMQELRGEH